MPKRDLWKESLTPQEKAEAERKLREWFERKERSNDRQGIKTTV